MTLKQGSHNLNPGTGGGSGGGRRRGRKPARTWTSALKEMSLPGKIVIGVLAALLLWALLSLLFRWVLPNRQDRETIDSVREMKGVTAEATLAPEASAVPAATAFIKVISSPQATAESTEAPRVGSATAVPTAAAANATAAVTSGEGGLTKSPELLQEYISLYAQNSDMCGWIRVRAIRNIDIPYVRGKNDYYIHHDFYGRESVAGTAFLDETCTDWPRDKNLIIYAHNLKSGEMFGELNRLSSLTLLRSNPFVDCDTLYDKGVYIPVAVYVCSVDPADPTYFNFNLSSFRSGEEMDAYVRRAKELNRVSIDVDVAETDDLLTLVTCRDEAGMERFVVLLRRLRAGETESSVRSRYFR